MSTAPDVVAVFAAIAAGHGDRIALEFADRCYTYAELDAITNRLAHRLLAMGVVRDSLVGISLPRGPGELFALLATLKAGGAYVPMAPSLPLDRLLVMQQDAAPQVMVVSSETPLSSCAGERVLVLENIDAAIAGFPATAVALTHDPHELAYVMFTSGSTGRPKGVEVPRRALANFLRSMAHTPGLGMDERLLAITTTAFDIAGLELLLPLTVGATIVLADLDTMRDPRLVRRRLERGDITIMQATPAMWRLLLESGWQGDARLRMLCGGEALTGALADALLAAGGELWNMYGPTETTIWSSCQRIEAGWDRITIGTPIDATQLVLLDDTNGEALAGAEGEIGIGGDGLARGYRGRPELTAEKFVTLPDGQRVYRTGDLGRRLADGRFEWLGRLDHQVKIRGFRIELGEIQTILRAVPGVDEVLVVADPRDTGEPRLVAYWVGAAHREDLVQSARRHLPSYMVPASYVRLDAFPLNPNGKIDRKQLPAPETLRDTTVPPALARNDTETRIAAAWRDVLGVPVIPRNEDFFTLGGTSVLAMEMIVRLEQELGTPIALAGFFKAPTVEGMAAALGESSTTRDAPIVVWLRQGAPERAPLFCLFGVHLYQDLALALDGDRPVIGAHVPFRYVPGRDTRPSLGAIASRYVDLIRTYQPNGPYDLLGLCFGGIVAYEVAHQLEAAGERVDNVAIIDAILPNAVRVHTARRLRAFVGSAQRALKEPQDLEKWLRRQGETLAAKVPLLGKLKAAAARTNGTSAIDLPIDGPEVEAEVRRFAGAATQLSAKLLVVRALGERTPDWMAVDATHGWSRRAANVRVHDIHADHLGVLRHPHVRSLARVLDS